MHDAPLHPQRMPILGAYLRIQQVPLEGPPLELGETTGAPAIRLWLVGEHIDLNSRCEELMAGDSAPYWAFCWASGQALARFLMEYPEYVRGKHVVDFGSGSGVAGIAAAMAGAARVTAVDIDPRAQQASLDNADLNGVTLEASAVVPDHFDVLLAADVIYDSKNLALVRMLRERCDVALLADPRRQSSPAIAESPLARYEVRTLPDVDYPMRHAVLFAL